MRYWDIHHLAESLDPTDKQRHELLTVDKIRFIHIERLEDCTNLYLEIAFRKYSEGKKCFEKACLMVLFVF